MYVPVSGVCAVCMRVCVCVCVQSHLNTLEHLVQLLALNTGRLLIFIWDATSHTLGSVL